MSELIHGHEVLNMILASKKKFTKKSLEEAIHRKFGRDARFYTCSAENMTAKELIEFLDARDKFVFSKDGFTANPDKICKD